MNPSIPPNRGNSRLAILSSVSPVKKNMFSTSGASSNPMIFTERLTFQYAKRQALNGVDLSVDRGEMFGLLGPNGSGKSTLFKILSTALHPGGGRALIDGLNTVTQGQAVRSRLGVVFQSPSLDPKLTVGENIRFQGYLFGLRGRKLADRVDVMLERFNLTDRRRDKAETLSGGLKRRVELAKTLLHSPGLLLLDEPSTGLDPTARVDLWNTLALLRREEGLSVLVATHLMDEAERCDRVGLMDGGRLVEVDTPEKLKRQVGGDVVTLTTEDPETLARDIVKKTGLPALVADGQVRIEGGEGIEVAAKGL
ncbi:MAG: ABC transporter ATP-binding protein, partial [Deltaproteobacteria bacterium]|nr:ABC transporter ATP-binding protein [Deltaproteobacteria bacterium]